MANLLFTRSRVERYWSLAKQVLAAPSPDRIQPDAPPSTLRLSLYAVTACCVAALVAGLLLGLLLAHHPGPWRYQPETEAPPPPVAPTLSGYHGGEWR